MTTKDNHHLKAVLFKDFNQNECNNRYFFSGLFSFLSGLIISFQVEQDLKGRISPSLLQNPKGESG